MDRCRRVLGDLLLWEVGGLLGRPNREGLVEGGRGLLGAVLRRDPRLPRGELRLVDGLPPLVAIVASITFRRDDVLAVGGGDLDAQSPRANLGTGGGGGGGGARAGLANDNNLQSSAQICPTKRGLQAASTEAQCAHENARYQLGNGKIANWRKARKHRHAQNACCPDSCERKSGRLPKFVHPDIDLARSPCRGLQTYLA